MLQINRTIRVGLAWAMLALSGCSSSGGDDDPQPPPSPPPPPPPASTYTVGGNATGITGNTVLQLNGGNNFAIGASGPFTFGTQLASGAAYAVTVFAQPAGQNCTVANGTGTVAAANVANITVTCTSTGTGSSFSVGGAVSGLSGSMLLRLNGAHDLTVTASGPFAFDTTLAGGAAYAVSIGALPTTQTCVLTNGNGTIGSADVTNVTVNCADYSVGGSITGLKGAGLVLQANGGNDMTVAAGSASFTFPSTLSLGSIVYNLHIAAQPAGQTCTIVKAVGFVTPMAPNATSAAVACTDNVTSPLAGTYELKTVDGVAVPERGFVTLYADGTYIFAIHSDDPDCDASNGNGIEYGVYHWNSTTSAFAFVTTALDTNGECGIGNGGALLKGSLARGAGGRLSFDLLDNNGSGDRVTATFDPVASTPGTLIGSWGMNQVFIVHDGNGRIFAADTRAPVQLPTTSPGIEDGCYTLSGTPSSGAYTVDFSGSCAVGPAQVAIDTTGPQAGLSTLGTQSRSFSVAGDTMEFWVGANPHLTVERIKPN